MAKAIPEGYPSVKRYLHVDGAAEAIDFYEKAFGARERLQLGVFGIVFGQVAPGALAAFIDRTLGPVLQHDASRNATLWQTLAAFFDEGGHLVNTGRRLEIHINTLYQRLERLDELLGADWRTPDRRLELHLATRLLRLRGELAARR